MCAACTHKPNCRHGCYAHTHVHLPEQYVWLVRTHLAAESSKDRQEWMTAIAAARARSVFGATPSSHISPLVLTKTEQLHRQQHASAVQPQALSHMLSPGLTAQTGVMLQSMKSAPAAAPAEAAIEVSSSSEKHIWSHDSNFDT